MKRLNKEQRKVISSEMSVREQMEFEKWMNANNTISDSIIAAIKAIQGSDDTVRVKRIEKLISEASSKKKSLYWELMTSSEFFLLSACVALSISYRKVSTVITEKIIKSWDCYIPGDGELFGKMIKYAVEESGSQCSAIYDAFNYTIYSVVETIFWYIFIFSLYLFISLFLLKVAYTALRESKYKKILSFFESFDSIDRLVLSIAITMIIVYFGL